MIAVQMMLRVEASFTAGIDVCGEPYSVCGRAKFVLVNEMYDVAMPKIKKMSDGGVSCLVVIGIDP